MEASKRMGGIRARFFSERFSRSAVSAYSRRVNLRSAPAARHICSLQPSTNDNSVRSGIFPCPRKSLLNEAWKIQRRVCYKDFTPAGANAVFHWQSCTADFQVCCIAGFQTCGRHAFSTPCRFGNRRYSRFGNLRYAGFANVRKSSHELSELKTTAHGYIEAFLPETREKLFHRIFFPPAANEIDSLHDTGRRQIPELA